MNKIIIVIICSFICSPTFANNEIIDVSSLIGADGLRNDRDHKNDKANAAILVKAAEKLMTPAGLIFADDLVNVALILDPSNFKAQFYRRLIAPAREYIGFYRRIKPIVQKIENSEKRNEYYKNVADIKSSTPYGGYRDFLFGGDAPAWENESDLQKSIDRTVQRLDELRLFIKNNKGRGLKGLIISTALTDSNNNYISFADIIKKCNVTEKSVGVYEISLCPYIVQRSFQVSKSDWETLQSIVAGTEMGFVFMGAYNLHGWLHIQREQNKRENSNLSPLTDKELTSIVTRYEDFGKLRKENKLFVAPDLAADVVSGSRWLKANEKNLCVIKKNKYGGVVAYGVENDKNLFINGACIYPDDTKEFEHATRQVDVAISGGLIIENLLVRSDTLGKLEAVTLRPMTLIEHPISDLKEILPAKFNSCGYTTQFKDESLGGLFVNGNASRYTVDENRCSK